MTDQELKQHIESALEWEPSFDAADIGVSVEAGVVTLRGEVSSTAAKSVSERVALRTYSVKAVANDLTVRTRAAFERTDTDIAQAAVTALTWNAAIPANCVTVTVSDGWLTLAGTLEWQFQEEAAARAMRNLTGVTGVTNSVTVKPRVQPGVQAKIEAAFKRGAEIDPRHVDRSFPRMLGGTSDTGL
jgi:osmotically-inducible protein OsmY